MYIWPFIQGPWIILSTSSLKKLCEGGSFILQTGVLMLFYTVSLVAFY